MVRSIKELKVLVSNYNILLKKAEKLVGNPNFSAEQLSIDAGDDEIYVDISGTETYCRCSGYEIYSIPARWFFMSDKEIEAEKKLMHEREAEVKRRALARIQKKAEKEERKEYERLKKKFEG